MNLFRRHLTFANVMSCIAVFIALATGGAYAANTIFSEDIVDGEVKSRDILNETITSGDVLNNSLRAADVGVDEIDTSELAPGAVTDDELDASTLAGLATESFVKETAEGCDPTAATYIECGTERLEVTLDAPSDIVVMAEGSWFGTTMGPDAGECRIEGDGLEGRVHAYGQIGDEHAAAMFGAPIAQFAAFQSLDAGNHEIWFACREVDANFQVAWVDLTAVRVGEG